MRNTVQNDTPQPMGETIGLACTLLTEGYGTVVIILDDEGRSIPLRDYRVYGLAEWTTPSYRTMSLEEGIESLEDMLHGEYSSPSMRVTLQYHDPHDKGIEHPTRR